MIKNRYNLIDEKWIPVAEKGCVNLKTIFSDETITALGGTPIEKIALFKFFLAIAQSAYTPKNEVQWENYGMKKMQITILDYLQAHHEEFWLYGEKPFLQMNEIVKAKIKDFGVVQPSIASGNTTLITQIQTEKLLDDSRKALLLLSLMGFATGGKKTDNSIVLSTGYTKKYNAKGKPSSGRFGPSLAFMGLLHNFIFFDSIMQSVYLNMFSEEGIQEMGMYPNGVGIAPWEKMPQGEDDEIARNLSHSYMGRLIPLSRFILLEETGLHYSEGIVHLNYADGVVDPSVAVNFGKKTKVLWVDPEKRPWRQMPALLAFMKAENSFNCFQLKNAINHCKWVDSFTIWSGGLRVSSNAGEQYCSGTDDFVESQITLPSSIFSQRKAAFFYTNLKNEMDKLDALALHLYKSIFRYYKDLKTDGKAIAAKATNMYWQLCENKANELFLLCCEDEAETELSNISSTFLGFAFQVYDTLCGNQTARQMEAWAKNRHFYNKKEA